MTLHYLYVRIYYTANTIRKCFFLKMVSNLYLNRVLYFLREFKGTFSCNNLPPFTPTDKREFFIVNLSKVEEKGSHFIYLEKYNDIIFYWDPLGISLHNPHIINFHEKSKLSRVICISNIVQNINSISCGLYCLNLGMVFTKIIENRTNKLTSPLFFKLKSHIFVRIFAISCSKAFRHFISGFFFIFHL